MITKKSAQRHLEDYLREFVYGGMDGVVTTYAVVAGATGANFGSNVILVLGFANLLADGFSMSVGAYLSTKSEYEIQKKRGQKMAYQSSAVLKGVATYIAFILIGMVPMAVYALQAMLDIVIARPFLTTSLLTAAAFVGIGVLKSRVSSAPMARSIAETLVLGTVAASFAFAVGNILEKAIAG